MRWLRDRDRSRLGNCQFIEKLLRGENPFQPEKQSLWLGKPAIQSIDRGGYFEGAIWAIPQKNAINLLLMVAKSFEKYVPGSKKGRPVPFADVDKSFEEWHALATMKDKSQQRAECQRWIAELKAAKQETSNPRVAVPHFRA